jgi:signal transduction histidine kinase
VTNDESKYEQLKYKLSHQLFRGPIARIKGLLNLLRKAITGNKEAEKYADMIDSEIKDFENKVDNIN